MSDDTPAAMRAAVVGYHTAQAKAAEEYIDMLLGDAADRVDDLRVASKGPDRIMAWLQAPEWLAPAVRRFCRGADVHERAQAGAFILEWMERTGFDPAARDGKRA